VAVYSSIGGFLSVAWTDMFQFIIAMAGCIILAVLVLNSDQVGGMSGLKEKLGPDNPAFNFLPNLTAQVGTGGMVGITLSAFVAFLPSNGGPLGIPAASRAAAATSRSA
jgi:solute:Na+ symporter, SSS family